jgi:hypothetical protein
VSPPIALEFADPASGVRGWIGRGVPGIGGDEQLVLVCDGSEVVVAERTPSGAGPLEIEITGAETEGTFAVGPAKAEFKNRTLEAIGAVSEPPAGKGAELARAVVALNDGGLSVALRSERPAGTAAHGAERAEGLLLDAEGPQPVHEPLLSTQYDESGAQTRAGLELWVGEADELPRRGAGTRVGGTAIDLDGWRLEAAFFWWTIEGAEGNGSYMIWRSA